MMHYDTAFTFDKCFQFELRWMIATGAVINDWMTARVSRKLQAVKGIQLVQIPSGDSPFVAPIFVALPERSNLHVEIDASELPKVVLENTDFVETKQDPTYYIHQSGMSMARIVENGISWSVNHLSSQFESKLFQETTVSTLAELRRICSSVAEIEHLLRCELDEDESEHHSFLPRESTATRVFEEGEVIVRITGDLTHSILDGADYRDDSPSQPHSPSSPSTTPTSPPHSPSDPQSPPHSPFPPSSPPLDQPREIQIRNEVSEQIDEQPKEQSSEQVNEQVKEQVKEQISEQPKEQASEQVDEPKEQDGEQASEQV